MVSFIHNGSEITTSMDLLEEKAQNPKQQDKNIFAESPAADH